ncbi:Ig-like domain-containing protein [archaeon]
MQKIVAVILLVLLVGCVSPQVANGENNSVEVVEDTVLNAPGITPSGYAKDGSVTIVASFDEPVVLTAFTIDDATQNVTRVNDKKYEVAKSLDDGTYTIVVSAEDAAGNTATQTVDLTIDSDAPTVSVDPENNEQTSKSDVNISFSFSEEVTIVEAKINSNALSLASSDNKEFTVSKNLNDGEHSLYVKAKDKAGNEVVSDTKFTVSVAEPDSTAPGQVQGVTATDTGLGGEVKLTWTASTAGDFKQYHVYKSVDDITSVVGKTPAYTIKAKSTTEWTISGLTNDVRLCFAVTAVDNANNEDYDVLASCIKPTESDKTPPSINDYYPADTVTNTTMPVITVITNEAAGCKYSISNESDKTWAYSNLTYSFSRDTPKTTHTKTHPASLGNDRWYVYVICEDLEDNMMAEAYDWNFDVDYTAPPNNAPSVSGVAIDPVPAYNSSTLTCDGTFADEDSDSESGSAFRWWNGGVMISGETSSTLASSFFVKSDSMKCEYKPSDGIEFGTPVNSSALSISNSAPALSSDNVNASTGNSSDGTNVFKYTIVYTDSDNDAPSYVKVNITSEGGSNEYSLAEEDAGDTDHTDGKTYYSERTLAAGNYTYWFRTSDGTDTDSTTETGDPTVVS